MFSQNFFKPWAKSASSALYITLGHPAYIAYFDPAKMCILFNHT